MPGTAVPATRANRMDGLARFHQFRKAWSESAFHILDILADNHRSHLLLRHRLLTLVKSDDPRLDEQICPIGGNPPRWNSGECFDKDRGL